MIPRPISDERPLWDLFRGAMAFPAVLVARDLKMFSYLAERPHDLKALSERMGTELRPTEALVSLCAAAGLIERKIDQYSLTEVGTQYLVEDSPTSFGGFLDMLVANYQLFTYESVKKAILQNASQVYRGKDLFESNERDLALARAFTSGMHGHSMGAALGWPDKIDLSKHKMMIDVGGGSGAHSIGALDRWSNLKAVIYDLPHVCAVAHDFIKQYGFEDRISTANGDWWEDPLPKGDIHFYSDIFHDWPPEKCRFLAQKSFESLESGGRIILHEMLFNERKTGPFMTAAYSVTMMLWTQGQQFSGKELENMLLDVGFEQVQIVPTFGYWSIVSGTKP